MRFTKQFNGERFGKTLLTISALLVLSVGFQNCSSSSSSTGVTTSISQPTEGSPIAQDMINLPGDEIATPMNNATSSNIQMGQLPSSLTTSAYASCTSINQISNSATVVDTIYMFNCPAPQFNGTFEIQVTNSPSGKAILTVEDYQVSLANGETISGHRTINIVLDTSNNPTSITTQFSRQGTSTNLDYVWNGQSSLTYSPSAGEVMANGVFNLTDHGDVLGTYFFSTLNLKYDPLDGFTAGSIVINNPDEGEFFTVTAKGSNRWTIELNGKAIQPSGI